MAGKMYKGYLVKAARGYDDLFFKFSFDDSGEMYQFIETVLNYNREDPRRSEGDNDRELKIEITLLPDDDPEDPVEVWEEEDEV